MTPSPFRALFIFLTLWSTFAHASQMLEGLKDFSLRVTTDTESQSAGILKQDLEQKARAKIKAMGVNLQSVEGKPELLINIQTLSVSKKARATQVVLTLHEWARLGRSPKFTHFVTTWTSSMLISASPQKIAAEAEKAVHLTLDDFLTAFSKEVPTSSVK